MSELLAIQRALQQHLLAPEHLETELALAGIVRETESVSRALRLNIYANAYSARLVEALSVDFGMLHAYLGDDVFAELVHGYIAQYPSRYFSLRGVGGDLAEFLRATAPYADHVELHELAAFEWALCHAFDAQDTECAVGDDFAALAPVQWPELTLRFVPAMRVLNFGTNAPSIWKALSAGQMPPAVEIFAEPQCWIVWRRDLKLLFRSLETIEATAFAAFGGGGTFAEVCARLADMLPENEVPPRAAGLLQQWLQDGLIAA